MHYPNIQVSESSKFTRAAVLTVAHFRCSQVLLNKVIGYDAMMRIYFIETSYFFRLPYKLAPNPYFVISLNQVKVAKTKVKNSGEPFNDEQFTIE